MRAFMRRLVHAELGFDVNRAAQSSDTGKAFFVPFRLLPTQFLWLEGDEPVSTFFASDEHGGLRIGAVRAVVAVAAALDSILTAFALAPASV